MLNNIVLQDFIEKENVEILYITEYGSKLYGTDNENSDTDYKGIFFQNPKKALVGKGVNHFSYSTGNNTSANTAKDIDIELFSLNKWHDLLIKGEIGAVDLLFSIINDNSTVFADIGFQHFIRANYKSFLSNNVHSFIGYAIGQSKRYNVKGKRYQELLELQKFLTSYKDSYITMANIMTNIMQLVKIKSFEYINVVNKSGNKDGDRTLEYLEVLGKYFSEETSIQYVLNHVNKKIETFGNRAKKATENGIDWKGMSHAVRVLFEIDELQETNFITFPLIHRAQIKDIKEGKIDLDTVINLIDNKLDKVNKNSKITNLPNKINQSILDNYIVARSIKKLTERSCFV